MEEDAEEDEVDEDEEPEERKDEDEEEDEAASKGDDTSDWFCFRCHRGSDGVRIVMVYCGGEIGMRGGLFHCE